MNNILNPATAYTGYDWENPIVPEEWMDDALCAQGDPEAFFPEKGGSTRAAKKLCGGCDVREKCLQYALGRGERYGIWGGMSERERAAMRKGSAA